MATVMLSSIDNPYNPFEDFDSWRLYDIHSGAYCCELLSRLVLIRSDMTEEEIERNTEEAIDKFISIDPLHMYIKCKK